MISEQTFEERLNKLKSQVAQLISVLRIQRDRVAVEVLHQVRMPPVSLLDEMAVA